MKHLLALITAGFLSLLLTPAFLLAATPTVLDRTAGYILLQVQEHGEAWYVHPTEHLRYYMKDGQAAYEMMRSFGLGITNSDLANIPAVESVEEMKTKQSICSSNKFAKNVQGKILLQVQEHGEAWYVYPSTCYRIYMKNGDEAYRIMRHLGLGITNSDLEQINFGAIKVSQTEPTPPQAPVEPIVVEEIIEVPVSEPVLTQPQIDAFAGVELKTVVRLLCGANDVDVHVLGSGTIFDSKGKIITNAHVLGQNPALSRCIVWVPGDEMLYYAEIQDVWEDIDVAVLRITGEWLNNEMRVFQPGEKEFLFVSRVCSAEEMDFGDDLWVVGYPSVGGYTLNVTDGVISGTHGAYVKTSAKVEYGNSGGAAFHTSGCWIGIPTFSSVGEIESIGYILSPALMEEPFI